MKHRIALGITTSIFAYISLCPGIYARTWTNDKGSQFEGELTNVEDNIAVIIRASDKKMFRVPLPSLSEADQEFIREFVQTSTNKGATDDGTEDELSEIEIKAIEFQRTELLEKASEEESPDKAGFLLADAAILLLQIDEGKAKRELNKVLKEYGKESYTDVGARVLLAQANHLAKKAADGDDKAWDKAEDFYQEVWENFPGVYSEKGCEAANIVAEHYLSLGDTDKAAELKNIVVEKRGTNGVLGGEACLWLAGHYESAGDKVKALAYLNKITTSFKTTKSVVQKAKVRIEALKKTVDD